MPSMLTTRIGFSSNGVTYYLGVNSTTLTPVTSLLEGELFTIHIPYTSGYSTNFAIATSDGRYLVHGAGSGLAVEASPTGGPGASGLFQADTGMPPAGGSAFMITLANTDLHLLAIVDPSQTGGPPGVSPLNTVLLSSVGGTYFQFVGATQLSPPLPVPPSPSSLHLATPPLRLAPESNRQATLFLPSRDGFQFMNSSDNFPNMPITTVTASLLGGIGSLSFDAGNMQAGLCGGMVYAALDFFLDGHRPIPFTQVPFLSTSSRMLQYLLGRLLDSLGFGRNSRPSPLGLPEDAATYVAWLDSTTSLHSRWFGGGLAQVMLEEEWPRIRDGIGSGIPVPIGLVVNQSIAITNGSRMASALGQCHQVLAYAHEVDAHGNVSIYVYDPDDPDNDGSIIRFNSNDPGGHTLTIDTPSITIATGDRYKAFFASRQYSAIRPPIGL